MLIAYGLELLPLFGVAILLLFSWLNYVCIIACVCVCARVNGRATEYSSSSDNGNKPRSSGRNGINRIRFKSPFSFEIDSVHIYTVHWTLPFDSDGYTFVFVNETKYKNAFNWIGMTEIETTKWTLEMTNTSMYRYRIWILKLAFDIWPNAYMSWKIFTDQKGIIKKWKIMTNTGIPSPISCNSCHNSSATKKLINIQLISALTFIDFIENACDSQKIVVFHSVHQNEKHYCYWFQ